MKTLTIYEMVLGTEGVTYDLRYPCGHRVKGETSFTHPHLFPLRTAPDCPACEAEALEKEA